MLSLLILLWNIEVALIDWSIENELKLWTFRSQVMHADFKCQKLISCASTTAHDRFPALCISYFEWVLIGPLYWLCPFWLAKVTSLVLVLRHSIESSLNCIVCYYWFNLWFSGQEYIKDALANFFFSHFPPRPLTCLQTRNQYSLKRVRTELAC